MARDYSVTRYGQYWATLPPEQLCGEVMSRWKMWREYYWNSGIGVKADKGRRYYYGFNDLGEQSSRASVGGQNGQYIKIVLNKVRPIVQRSLAMILTQAPTMQPVAANSDSVARQQAILARGYLEHVHRELDTDAIDAEVLEIAMTMGEAYRMILWDANAGKPEAIDPDTEQPVALSGDFVNHPLTPFDVAKDPSWRSSRMLPWVMARTFENKWELAARYPEKAEQILAATEQVTALGEGYDMRLGTVALLMAKGDAIPVYRFFHVDSNAVRGGRAFTCLNEGTWLEDGPNPYQGLPVERCAPGPVIATSLGYSNIFDALGVADLINSLESVIATHTIRWGIRPLVDFEGSGLQASTLGNGTSLLKVKGPDYMPRPLDVPPLPPDVLGHLKELAGVIVEVLGQNSTAMGNPPFSGMAAQAMALLDQKAREFNDGLSKSYDAYKQACATRELRILKKFADDPRVAVVQGKAKQWMLKSFTKEDLANVDRVAMESAPAGTGTLAWKVATVEMLQRMSPEQLAAVPLQQLMNLIRTGEYESLFEDQETNVLRIKSENEGLMDGNVPTVILARTHWIDIPQHLALLSAPDVVNNPKMVDAVLSTVEAKLAAWRSMPPDILMLLKGPPAPPSAEQLLAQQAMPLPPNEGQNGGQGAPPAPPPPPLSPQDMGAPPELPVPPMPNQGGVSQ
jgi:hypothetical protein